VDWPNERYVRIYTRDTLTWKLLDWRARCVLVMLLRKVDRSGVLELGDDTNAEGLAAMIELPLEIVEAGIGQLTDPKRAIVAVRPAEGYFVPNFLAAQEAKQSDAQRSREHRARVKDLAKLARFSETPRDASVTIRDGVETGRSGTVTPARPAEPSRPARPALDQQSSLSPHAPDGWSPPAGGRSENVKNTRIAAGEISEADYKRSLAAFRDHAIEKGLRYSDKQLDAAFAKWLRRERPLKPKRDRRPDKARALVRYEEQINGQQFVVELDKNDDTYERWLEPLPDGTFRERPDIKDWAQ